MVALTAREGQQKRADGCLSRLARRLLGPILIPLGVRAARKLCVYRVDRT